MIKFIAHTVREFATERDFQEFMDYLREANFIPAPTLKQIDENGHGELSSREGENGDCSAKTTWRIEGRT